MNAIPDLIGLGQYTVPETARLTEVSPARVRGWVQGSGDAGRGRRPAIVEHVLPSIDGRTALSFRELIEVRFVRHFLRAGVTWRNIRRAAAEARRDLLDDADHRLRFSTDGVTIFADVLARDGDSKARDLVANQYVMLGVLKQSCALSLIWKRGMSSARGTRGWRHRWYFLIHGARLGSR